MTSEEAFSKRDEVAVKRWNRASTVEMLKVGGFEWVLGGWRVWMGAG